MASLSRQDLFLLISKNLEGNELRDLRNYVGGAGILAKGFVQKANGHEIFNQIEKENKLKQGDLSLLAKVLRQIGRDDYAERAEKVAADERKVLQGKSGPSPTKGTRSPKPSCSSTEETTDGRDTERGSEHGFSPSTVMAGVGVVVGTLLGAAVATKATQDALRDNELSRLRKLSSDFQLTLESIFSRLDETEVRKLLRVWSSRSGQQESAGIERPQDLMRAMVKSGYIPTGELGMLERDMMAAGISFPVIVRDIPGVPDKFQYPRTTEASVGPDGGEVEIPGFVKLVVPQDVLQRETTITVSTVDIPGILRGDEGASWTSGYPWSLGDDACSRELLDQMLFSPAVDVNLHGAQLNGPVELETWRPPGSDGMKCVLLKHHDGEGWTDITASTLHQMYPDKISISLQTFSLLDILWIPVDAVITGITRIFALNARTLNCSFAAYADTDGDVAEFHVVCKDKSGAGTNEYRPGFTRCGHNDARFDLFHRDRLEFAVSVRGGHAVSMKTELRAVNCRDRYGQNVQMFIERPTGERLRGEVVVRTSQERTVCQFVFKERGDTRQATSKMVRRPGVNIGKRSLSRSSQPKRPEKKTKVEKTQDDRAGPGGLSTHRRAKVDVQKYFEDVIKEVSAKWDDLARKLGFSEDEIKCIGTTEPSPNHRCREVLNRWRNEKGRKATLQVLKQALIDIGKRWTAENLGDGMTSGESPTSSDE